MVLVYIMFQFPFGRKEHCDIHWNVVSFEENPDLYGGKVNKFPGKLYQKSLQFIQ
jgi:hypothetical protein